MVSITHFSTPFHASPKKLHIMLFREIPASAEWIFLPAYFQDELYIQICQGGNLMWWFATGKGGRISLKMQIEAVKLQKPKNRTQKKKKNLIWGLCAILDAAF